MHTNDDDDAPTWGTAPDASPDRALAPRAVDAHGSSGDNAWDDAAASNAPWQREMVRWLATLNPGRTQREYEKAVRYFFETPGVPGALDALTFDLLLAYRGALALRATPHRDTPPTGTRRPRTGPTLAAGERPVLEGATPSGASAPPDGASAADEAAAAPLTPLAPATVNIRLTALRQFLVHCSLFGSLPQLTPDRVRAALRRLTADRRRPYAVLAEPEWAQFLEAARLPAVAANSANSASSANISDAHADTAEVAMTEQGPWGVPRAVRQAAEAEREAAEAAAEPDSAPPQQRVLVRSRAGLTGVRTAQRDHALLSLALATGLRAIELASLDLGDLSREWHAGQEEWWLVLPDAKTKGQHGGRTLPLAPQVVEVLLAYVAESGRTWERQADRATPLFLSRRLASGGVPRAAARLSPVQIRRIVDRVESQWLALRGLRTRDGTPDLGADTRSISPHALRHSTAIALLEGNEQLGRPPASVEHVRGWLGHFDIRTTQGYLAHLEARRHRRPFTLAPPAPPPAPPTEDAGE